MELRFSPQSVLEDGATEHRQILNLSRRAMQLAREAQRRDSMAQRPGDFCQVERIPWAYAVLLLLDADGIEQHVEGAVGVKDGPLGSAVRRRRAVLLLATAYFALFGIFLAQALMGQPLLAPRGPIAIAFGAWGIASIAGVSFVAGWRRSATAGASLPFVVSR